MKKALLIWCFFALTVSAYSHAKETTIADVISDPAKYLGKPIVIEGSFSYAEPIRESFTIDQNGSTLEVFFHDLPGRDREYILSQQKYSKAELIVSGIMQQYTNSAGSYFIKATALQYEKGDSTAAYNLSSVSYDEILSDHQKYLKKEVTMKGFFLYGEPVRQSFSFDQGGNIIEVLISDLSKMDREAIFSQRKNSRSQVIVTGQLLPYVNSDKKHYINATSVILGK